MLFSSLSSDIFPNILGQEELPKRTASAGQGQTGRIRDVSQYRELLFVGSDNIHSGPSGDLEFVTVPQMRSCPFRFNHVDWELFELLKSERYSRVEIDLPAIIQPVEGSQCNLIESRYLNSWRFPHCSPLFELEHNLP